MVRRPIGLVVDAFAAGWDKASELGQLTREGLRRLLSRNAGSRGRDEVYRVQRETRLLRRIAHSPVESSIALGWYTVIGDDKRASKDVDQALQLQPKVREALISARTSGGALLWMHNSDKDQLQPMPDGPQELRALHVVTRFEAQPGAWDTDDASPNFQRPIWYWITMQRDGAVMTRSIRVHWTRLVYVPGILAMPDEDTGGQGWDWSVSEVYAVPASSYHKAMESTGTILDRQGMPHFNFKDLDLAAGDDVDLTNRMSVTAYAMSNPGILLSFGDDSVSWTAPSLAGTDKVVQQQREDVCAVEGLSMVDLFGQPPGGLSTDDKGTERVQTLRRNAMRTFVVAPILDRLYDVLLGPGPRDYEWIEATIPEPEADARVALTYAQRDGVLIQAGVIAASEARERFREGQEQHEVMLLEEFEGGADVRPDAIEQALAELDRRMRQPGDEADDEDEPDDADEDA